MLIRPSEYPSHHNKEQLCLFVYLCSSELISKKVSNSICKGDCTLLQDNVGKIYRVKRLVGVYNEQKFVLMKGLI